METPASNAATDGGYGVSDTRHQAEIVLGKGKVDGSIPFGSTISFKDLASDKDIPPGSNEPAISDFIARGGSIKRGPTLVADGVRFWSPCSQPALKVERPLQVISYRDGVGLLYANPGRDRYNQARKAEFQARKELALNLSSKGLTARQIAEKMGVPRRTIHEYLKGTK
jgi:hypothetical protein